MRILVDGDIFIYRAGFATQYPKYSVIYGEDGDYAKEFQYKKDAAEFMSGLTDCTLEVTTITEPEANALHIFDSMLGGIAAKFGVRTQDLEVVLTGADNFRVERAKQKPYKGNRKDKPTHYAALRSHAVDKHHAHIVDGEEADDWLGYNQYPLQFFDPDASVIVTIDKDLDMIPGRHYNPVKDLEYYVDEDEADRFFLQQLIEGDSTDNIPGIRGMAAVKAAAYLLDIPTTAAITEIRKLYVKEYGDEADEVLDEQAALLWIRRTPHQDWKNYWYNNGDQV